MPKPLIFLEEYLLRSLLIKLLPETLVLVLVVSLFFLTTLMVQGQHVKVPVELIESLSECGFQLFEIMSLLSQDFFLVRVRLVLKERECLIDGCHGLKLPLYNAEQLLILAMN